MLFMTFKLQASSFMYHASWRNLPGPRLRSQAVALCIIGRFILGEDTVEALSNCCGSQLSLGWQERFNI
jgi:hypothetical protein